MRTVQLLISSLVLLAVFLIGCETTHKVQHVAKPTARMVSLRLQQVKLGYAILLFDVEIDNPYPSSLPLVGLSYSLTSGGGTFITATPIHQASVLPNSRQIVVLPDEVIYARLLRALNSKPGSTIPYRARIWLQVDVPNLGPVEVPLRHEGQLALPNPPEINKEHSNKHTICLRVAPLSKAKNKGNSWRSSFFRWSLDSTSPRFAASKPSKLGLRRLGWTLWPLCADIWYTNRCVVSG